MPVYTECIIHFITAQASFCGFQLWPTGFNVSTCTQQLLVDLLVYCQINVVVLLTAARQVAVNGVVPRLEDPVFVVF